MWPWDLLSTFQLFNFSPDTPDLAAVAAWQSPTPAVRFSKKALKPD